MGEKMGKKSIFHLDFGMDILKFSQKFQILIGCRPNAQKPINSFLNFFYIIKDFQNFIKIALIFY